GSVEQQSEIGLESFLHPVFEKSNHLGIYAAATALVRITGIGKPVANHPDALSQRRFDDFFDVLGASSEHQQKFRLHGYALRIDHQPPNSFAYRRSSGLSGDEKLNSEFLQVISD